MIGKWFGKFKVDDSQHPTEETLIACADGELSGRKANSVRAHLENCWICRAQLDELQDGINQFVNFRTQIQDTLVEPPPTCRNDFERRLKIAAEELSQQAAPQKKFVFWTRFRQIFDFGAMLSRFRQWFETIRNINFSLRLVAASLGILLMAALLFYQLPSRTVSAAELLKRAETAEFATDKVVRRKIVLQSKPLDPTEEKFVRNFEVWIDPFQKVKIQRVYLEDEKLLAITKFADNKITTYTPQSKVPSSPVMPQIPGKLIKIMNAWEHGLTLQDFQDLIGDVSKAKVEEQQNLYRINYSEAEGTMKAVLVLDKETLRPVKLSLEHKFNGNIFSYEFAETEFEAFEPNAVNNNAFEIDADFIESKSKAVK